MNCKTSYECINILKEWKSRNGVYKENKDKRNVGVHKLVFT